MVLERQQGLKCSFGCRTINKTLLSRNFTVQACILFYYHTFKKIKEEIAQIAVMVFIYDKWFNYQLTFMTIMATSLIATSMIKFHYFSQSTISAKFFAFFKCHRTI